MPELPEVETVRRMLESTVRGRTIRAARLSGLGLRSHVPRGLPRALAGRTIESVDRHGKLLLIGLDRDRTLLSHLGMSGRWLFYPEPPVESLTHVHVELSFDDGARLLFQDPRRFGMARVVPTRSLARDAALAGLGPDPIADPPTGPSLMALAAGSRLAVKLFLLDQRRIAGLGNIYVSEILHRAGVDPRRRSRALPREAWDRIAREIGDVLGEAIERSGTTFSMYRTVWGEAGGYGDQLRVYDRSGKPCLRCGTPIRRIVQGQRSTFYCPACQGSGKAARGSRAGSRRAS
jgi:formamidopyrimidine-DNA glycosylase